MVESVQRTIPGAPPPSQVKTTTKKKKQKNVTNGDRSHSQEAISRAAKDASLMEKAPSHAKVNDSVKIQAKDLAEEAERNGAIAAAQILIEKENGSIEKESKSPLQVILTKRIKVLSKKLQRAVTYEALEEDKLNTDMKRIIASKPALEAGVAELTEASKALEIAEQEADKHSKVQTKLAVEAARTDLITENERRGAVLFQFLHLYSLFQPSSIPSFAPPPMPAVMAQATAQDLAAVGKLYTDLSSPAEVVPQDIKSTLVRKLASGSNDSILEGVSFQRVLDLIEGLSIPVVEQPEEEIETEAKDEEPSARGILFMQESEIDKLASKAPLEAAEDVKQAEPEGGAIDGIPTSVIKGGATERGQTGAKGIILGDEASDMHGKENGTAQAQVEEPINTTQVNAASTTKEEPNAARTAAQILNGPGPKSIDWANDDDDWGDMIMQPTTDPKLAATASIASEAPKINGVSNGSSAKTEQQKQQQSKGFNNHQKEQRANASQQESHVAVAPPSVNAAKGATEPDDDGFVVASSKRTKMQQQHQHQQQQQQQMNRNGGRGGRGGALRGQGGQGQRGGFTPRGDNRGRGRGRGGRQSAEQSSEA